MGDKRELVGLIVGTKEIYPNAVSNIYRRQAEFQVSNSEQVDNTLVKRTSMHPVLIHF